MCIGIHVKCPLLLSFVNETWNFSGQVFEKEMFQVSKFHENQSSGQLSCWHADGQTDSHDEADSCFSPGLRTRLRIWHWHSFIFGLVGYFFLPWHYRCTIAPSSSFVYLFLYRGKWGGGKPVSLSKFGFCPEFGGHSRQKNTLIMKANEMHCFLKFILVKNSACFGQICCPPS